MGLKDVADAMLRVRTVLERKPEMGLHEDVPASVRWQRGTRVIATHANGTEVETDVATEIGGSGDRVSPGWMFRAGMASCSATSIAMVAAEEGIELTRLEIGVTSKSDARGLLGMSDENGQRVYAGSGDLEMHVKIAASNATPERLKKLVEDGNKRAPICNAVTNASPVALHVEAGEG